MSERIYQIFPEQLGDTALTDIVKTYVSLLANDLMEMDEDAIAFMKMHMASAIHAALVHERRPYISSIEADH